MREGYATLFDEPFGAEGTVRDWWSGPAANLGLPLLADIYEHGFHLGVLWGPKDFPQVLAELDLLESHWKEMCDWNVADESTGHAVLAERAEFVRRAIAIATEVQGYVVIT